MVVKNHGVTGKNAGGLGPKAVEDARSANARSAIDDDFLEESIVARDDNARTQVPSDIPLI